MTETLTDSFMGFFRSKPVMVMDVAIAAWCLWTVKIKIKGLMKETPIDWLHFCRIQSIFIGNRIST